MLMEGDRVEATQMSPSSCQLGLSVVRLRMDDPLAPSAVRAGSDCSRTGPLRVGRYAPLPLAAADAHVGRFIQNWSLQVSLRRSFIAKTSV